MGGKQRGEEKKRKAKHRIWKGLCAGLDSGSLLSGHGKIFESHLEKINNHTAGQIGLHRFVPSHYLPVSGRNLLKSANWFAFFFLFFFTPAERNTAPAD